MIVCKHSKVVSTTDGWSIEIPEKISGVIGIYPGQTLFASIESDSGRMLLSPLKLTPQTSFFRIFLENIRGSLAQVTKLFSDRDINILSGGAFGFGNIWVSEILADFSNGTVNPDEITNELINMGGFISSRELTELFPRSFSINATYTVKEKEGKMIISSSESLESSINRSNYAIIKAWSRLRAVFIDFFLPDVQLINIQARINDVPGSLFRLSEMIGTQVNLNSIDELHHDEGSGLWNAYGELVIGSLQELKDKGSKLDCVNAFEVKPLGWS